LPISDRAAIRKPEARSRWSALAGALALDDDERDLVLVAVAPELDRKYEPLYA
jgi:hypothetical protein